MDGKPRKKWWALAGLLLLVVLVCWLCWPDRGYARAKKLQEELFGPAARQMSAEQRREKFREFRAAQARLSPAQRRALGAEMRRRRQAEIARYFTMSPQDRARHLDEQIRRMERGRQAMANRGGQAGRGPGNRTGRSAEERDRRRQSFLDSSSPAARAQFSQYMRELNARRRQLGMPSRGR